MKYFDTHGNQDSTLSLIPNVQGASMINSHKQNIIKQGFYFHQIYEYLNMILSNTHPGKAIMALFPWRTRNLRITLFPLPKLSYLAKY